MITKLVELQVELKKLDSQVKEITLDDSGTERTGLSKDEMGEINTLLDLQDEILSQIEIEKRISERRDYLDQPDSKPATSIDQPDPVSGFTNFGEMIKAVVKAGVPGERTDPRLYHTRSITGMGETIPSDGGFLVGTDYSQEIVGSVMKSNLLASRCKHYQVSATSNSLKIPGVDETSRAAGSRFGGVRGYWPGEGGQITSSKPKFREINLNLNKLAILVYLTDELEMDTSALGSWVADVARQELDFQINDMIINGNGAGQPLGILNSNCLVSVAKETGQAATTFYYENLLKLWKRSIPATENDGVWLANRDVKEQFYSMSMIVGTGGAPVFLPKGGIANRPTDTLFGLPVLYIEQCATLGTKGDVILAHLPSYIIADKPMASAYSIHIRFDYDENVLRFIYRFDGQPLYSAALTPYKGTGSTLSPFVALNARS